MLEVEGLQRLVELQRVDDELAALEAEHAAVPSRRGQIAQSREACDERLAKVRESLEGAESDLRRAETDLQDQESLLHRLEGQQSQVKSNEAYTALLHEMDRARETISECETRILEAMERIETFRTALADTEQQVGVEREQLSGQQQTLDARETELGDEIARLRAQRKQACGQIAGDMLGRYERIAARKRPAVVLVSAEICSGCRVNIPSQSYHDLLTARRLITCENCHRILLHEQLLAGASTA